MPASSARVWIAWARDVLQTRRAHDAETLPDDIRDSFNSLLDEWDDLASSGAELRWQAEVEPAVLEWFVHGFYRVATRLTEEAERSDAPEAPAEGDAFYRALVNGLLDALSAEGGSVAQFADELRPFWPGLADDEGTDEST